MPDWNPFESLSYKGVAMFNQFLQCTSWDTRMESHTGYTAKEVLGKEASEIISDNQQEFFSLLFEKALRGRSFRITGTQNPFPKSPVKEPVTYLVKPIVKRPGKPEGVILEIIGDRSKTISSPGDDKFKSLVENLHEGVLMADVNGKIIYANNKLCKMIGYSKAELEGINSSESSIFSKELLKIKRTSKFRKRGNEYSYEISICKKNGESLPVRLHWMPLYNDQGDEVGSMASLADLSLFKQFEKVIRSKEEHYRALIESSSDVITIVQTDNTVLYASPSLKRILGQDPTEIIGRKIQEFVHREDEAMLLNTMKKALAAPGEVFIQEYRAQHQDGGWKYMETAIKALFSSEANSLVYIFNGRDISDHKKTEQLLQYKINELNTFTYKATHDLRAPLSSLLGLIAIAKTEKNLDELHQYFDLIDLSTRKMDKILMDLVDITKIAQGVPEITEVNLEQMLKGIFASLENLPGFHDIEISTRIELSKPFYTDAKLLGSVMQNLVDNSIKYKRASGKNSIHIMAVETANSVRISVSDKGIGIPEEFQKQIFDMFFRATTTSTGTGLGLYIVKNTVEKLGGSIDVESVVNSGSTFTITLPFNCPIP